MADHDFTKFSLTPSVRLIITIPDSILGSFYTGRGFMGLKENASLVTWQNCKVFCVLLMTIRYCYSILMVVRSPAKYATVQISLISIFLALDLDFLCAVRTPPYHSWKIPAKCIMSILNIGLQSVGVMRQKTQSFEELLTDYAR